MIYCTLRIAAKIFNGKHQSLKYLKHFYFFLYQAQITECHSFFFFLSASQPSGENSLGFSSYEDTDSDSTNEVCSKKVEKIAKDRSYKRDSNRTSTEMNFL